MKENSHRIFARDVVWVTISQVGTSLLGFVSFPVITKSLGADLYGTWSLLLVTASLVSPFVILGLAMSVVRFLAAEEDKSKVRDGFYSTFVIVGLLSFSASLLLAVYSKYLLTSGFLSSSFLGEAGALVVFQLGSFLIFTQSIFAMPLAYFQAFSKMKVYSILVFSKSVLEVSLLVYFLHIGLGIRGVIIASLISGAVFTMIPLIIVIKEIGISFPRFSIVGSYLRYGIPLIPNAVIVWVIVCSDRYIIEYFKEPKEVGVYSAGYNLANLLFILFAPIAVVLFPMVSRLYDNGDIVKTRKYFKFSFRYLMLISIPASFGMAVLVTPLLNTLTTGEFLSARGVLPILVAGMVVYNFYRIGVYTLHLRKKTYLLTVFLIITAVINIAICLLLVPRFGIIGAAISALVAYCILGVLSIGVGFRYVKFDLGWSFLLRSVVSSSIMAACLYFLHPVGIFYIILVVLLGVVIYVLMMLVLRGFDSGEMRELVGVFSGR